MQRFRYTKEGLSTIGVDTINDGSVFSFGSGDLASAGDFTIEGTALTLAYDNGDHATRFAVMMADGNIAIGNRVYNYKGQ